MQALICPKQSSQILLVKAENMDGGQLTAGSRALILAVWMI
jgi:hypothetical protein